MKVQVRQSPIEGVGVFTHQPILQGEVILRVDDSRVVDDAHPIRTDFDESERHCDYLPDGTVVLMVEPGGRFNHSCEPNVYYYSVKGQRYVLAMRDISEGEELFFDYSINADGGDTWTCECGSPNCRGRHKCGFFDLPEDRQLQYLPYIDPWFAEVHKQRLGELLEKSSPSR